MCIIAYKPIGVDFPGKKILRQCFNSNPDGAGFMYSFNNQVIISKGFMSFDSFYKALKKAKSDTGINSSYVLHFRISTQGGVKKELCHPYPLSESMNDLKQLDCSCNIGIAHNGVIDLTTSYYSKSEHNDTMLFITDYLSLIIRNRDYYKDAKTMQLIQRLVDSKLAILDSSGHCELIGDFIKDAGIYFSNNSYKARADKPGTRYSKLSVPYSCYDKPISFYNCSIENYGDDSGCVDCIDFDRCPYYLHDSDSMKD